MFSDFHHILSLIRPCLTGTHLLLKGQACSACPATSLRLLRLPADKLALQNAESLAREVDLQCISHSKR